MLKFMIAHVRCITILMVMMLASEIASAAVRTPIVASPNGPGASLKSSHHSVYFLAALEREDGSKLDPSDNGTWKDEKFYLPKSAKPNKGTYRQFIADTHKKTHRSSARKSSSPAPSACQPLGEPKVAEKSVSHAEMIVPTNYVIKVGEKVNFDGFKKTDGSLVTDLQYEESMAGVAALAAYQGTVTIRPLKPGKVTFTLWVNGDESVKREVSVEVVGSAANSPKSGSAILFPLLVLFAVCFLLFVIVLVVRSQQSKPLVQTLHEEAEETGETALHHPERMDEDLDPIDRDL